MTQDAKLHVKSKYILCRGGSLITDPILVRSFLMLMPDMMGCVKIKVNEGKGWLYGTCTCILTNSHALCVSPRGVLHISSDRYDQRIFWV